MKNIRISIVGLGYVGLPLACLFARKYEVTGFDISKKRVEELGKGFDATLEVESQILKQAADGNLKFTCQAEDMKDCNVYIVTVPTPVNEYNTPDLAPLESASRTVGGVIKKGDVVIYESTVYPGVTEKVCIPIIEAVSGLKFNHDFYAGYSPERINPGDKEHRVENIRKITSGSTPEVADFVDELYNSVLENGTYKASSIKIAESAKIIENAQRDVNIAFMNEIAIVMNSLGIDTNEVIDAASSKWNFLPFRPGLVGGHCISVDPHYLIQEAMQNGIIPRLMKEARFINNSMGGFVCSQIIDCMVQHGIPVKKSKVLILGITFKENCPDIRNTKVMEVYKHLQNYTDHVVVLDPYADKEEVEQEYGVQIVNDCDELGGSKFDVLVHCVSHAVFRQMDLEGLLTETGIIYDVKGTLDRSIVAKRL